MHAIDMSKQERDAYRAVTDTGLRDIFMASVVALFAIAPLLSGKLGDFWSSVIFLPVWGIVYLGIWVLRERVVVPRVGVVRWGAPRNQRLRRLGIAMLAVNILAFLGGLGAFALTRDGATSGWVFTIPVGLTVLALFSLFAYAVSVPRYYLYGLVLALAPLLGEWLWQHGHVSHHGFPVVFGTASVAIATIGLVRFARIARSPRIDDPAAGAGQ